LFDKYLKSFILLNNLKMNKHQIYLTNGKSFKCDENTTIFEAAKSSGLILEHSCLMGRCRSCIIEVKSGTSTDLISDMVLSTDEKKNHILSCISIPTSNMLLDVEDLRNINLYEKKIFPAKIQSINKLNNNVIELSLRLPPNSNFGYNPGQYVNITKGQIKRSYSIANAYHENGSLSFLIKKYENGLMSNYWFNEARANDLLRIEGPLGSFFLREAESENIIFLATGTGVAPIKAILENISELVKAKEVANKNLWLIVGARYEKDLFWDPNELNLKLNYIPVLSRASEDWDGERGYVQDIVIRRNISLENSQVYACGSNDMIQAAKKTLTERGLDKKHFFSDAFVATS
jgi:CDP-4-dehydro-6-deoxyglucose reductase